jgi:xylulokinase
MGPGTAGDADAVVVAIDLGTGGPKVAWVTLGGDVLAHRHRRVGMEVLAGGGATEDPAEWWEAVLASAGELRDEQPADPSRVVAVAVTGQWGSTVPVGHDGGAVGPCILWLDSRGRRHSAEHLRGRVSVEGYDPVAAVQWIRRAGGAPSPEGNDPLGQRLLLREEMPEVWERTAVLLEPVDYLNLRLTGRAAATQATMLLSWLTDNRTLDATQYDPVLVRLAGADPSRLPELLPIRSVVGEVRSEVAAAFGIPEGTPVVTGLPDLHSAALGTGAVADHQAHVCIGTSAWVGCHSTGKRTSLARQMATVPSAVPGRYILANNHDCGGVSYEWLLSNVVAPADGLGPVAGTPGAPTLAHLDAVAAEVPSGANGVVFVPWLKGERSPVADTAVRASFLNLGIDSGRPEMVRAVLEGLAHQVRWIFDSAEKVLRTRLGGPRLLGGGTTSDLWCQIHADVLGRSVERVAEPMMVNVRGAALFAGLVLGRLRVDDLASLVAVERTFHPDPAAKALHARLHREFVRIHRSQRGFHHALNRRS